MGALGIYFFPLHRMATVMPHYIGKLATASVIQSLFSRCDASFIYLFIRFCLEVQTGPCGLDLVQPSLVP